MYLPFCLILVSLTHTDSTTDRLPFCHQTIYFHLDTDPQKISYFLHHAKFKVTQCPFIILGSVLWTLPSIKPATSSLVTSNKKRSSIFLTDGSSSDLHSANLLGVIFCLRHSTACLDLLMPFQDLCNLCKDTVQQFLSKTFFDQPTKEAGFYLFTTMNH